MVSGQIAATALPDYTYQINLSAAAAKIATDRSATVTAHVMRSDGADVTSQFTNWNWTWPTAVTGAAFIRLATTAGGAVATFSSTLGSFLGIQGTTGASYTNTVTVTADGPSGTTPAPPASLQLAQYRAYVIVMNAPFGNVGTPILLRAQVIHNSDDALPDVTSQCAPQIWAPSGVTLTTTGNPDGQAYATASVSGDYSVNFNCTVLTNTVAYSLIATFLVLAF